MEKKDEGGGKARDQTQSSRGGSTWEQSGGDFWAENKLINQIHY